MELKSIADKLVEACRNGTDTALLSEHYATNAVSVEAQAMGDSPRETHGLEAIKGKHAWWAENFEMHSAQVDGPYPHGDDRFAVIFEFDVSEKASGQRWQMKEIAVYHVADGRIIREEFFGLG